MQSEGGNDNETYQNIEYTDIKQYSEKVDVENVRHHASQHVRHLVQ